MPGPRHRGRRVLFRASFLWRATNVLLVGAIVATGVIVVLRNPSGATSCTGDAVLTVEVAPRVAAPVRVAAEAYQKTSPEAAGRCVTIRVTTRAPHETARLLAGGWFERTAGEQPHVWIPDSTTWLELARLKSPARRLLPEAGTTLAISPVVIATPRKMAQALGWPGKRLSWRDIQTNMGRKDYWSDHGHAGWGEFRVVFTNPQASSTAVSAMLAMVSVAMGKPVTMLTPTMFTDDLFVKKVVLDLERKSEVIPRSDDDLLAQLRQADADGNLLAYMSAAPTTESAVFDFNRGTAANGEITRPKEPLVAVYPADGAMVQRVPFVTMGRASQDEVLATAANGFLAAMLGEIGTKAFVDEGLRTPQGANPHLDAEGGLTGRTFAPAGSASAATTAEAVATFETLHRRATSLVVLDTSGSMQQVVPGAGGRTRLEMTADALEAALPLVASESHLGLWQFATKLDGDVDYRELVPIGMMNEPLGGTTRADAVVAALRAMRPHGNTGLYDTTLAAFRAVTVNYTPGWPNQVVLMTDGKNEDPGSISLDELVAALEREYDPKRPVRLVTIAYGAEADAAALRRISAATKARSYPALDSHSIFRLVVDAVSSR